MVSPDQDRDSENPDMAAHDDTQKKATKMARSIIISKIIM